MTRKAEQFIQQYPELAGLDSAEQVEAVYSKANWRAFKKRVLTGFLLVGLAAVVLGLLSLPVLRGNKALGMIPQGWFNDFWSRALGFGMAFGFAFWVSRDVRSYLRAELNRLGVPVRIKCGYDLRGRTDASALCPECGTKPK